LAKSDARAKGSLSTDPQTFGYFGAVPPRARQVSAVAFDRSGEVLGRLGPDRLARSIHPTVFIAVEE
jgi:hypothetical protein